MMFKLLAVGCVALATAQDMPGIETKDGNIVFVAPSNVAFVKETELTTDDEKLAAANDKLNGDMGQHFSDIESIEGRGAATVASADAIMNEKDAIGTLQNQAKGIMDSLDGYEQQVAAAVEEGKAVHDATMTEIVGDMNAALKSAFDQLTATLESQQDTLTDDYQAKLITAHNVSDQLAVSSAAIASDIDAYEACAESGYLYRADTGECAQPKVDPKKLINKVHHRSFSNSDGRDSGYVNERYVGFQKYNDDTYMRIFYFDNFRVHGHHAHAMWNIMICDENGNGCDHCSDPGRLMNWRWAAHQSNWWMNDHVGQSVTGLCKKGGSRDLRKGKYRLRVMIDSNYYDMYTGHNQQQNNFMVDEVMKY